MKKICTLLPLAAVLAATPALAAPAITGRVEVHAGYDETRTKLELSTAAANGTTRIVLNPAVGQQTRRFSANDISGGVEAGADAKFGDTAVVGLYAGLDTSNIDECRSKVFGTTNADSACSKIGTSYNAGARVGIATGDGGLIYFKGGYTKARVRTSFTDRPIPATTTLPAIPATTVFNVSESLGGYQVGGGFELNVGRMLYTKLEYVRSVYDRGYKNVIVAPNNVDVRRNQITFGIGLKFGN